MSEKTILTEMIGQVTEKTKKVTTNRDGAFDGGEVCDTCNVKIKVDVKVDSIYVHPERKTIAIGEELKLYEIVYPYDASYKDVKWISDNPSIAFVDKSTGIVTAISEGTTIITALAQDGSNVSGGCIITVIKD